MQRAEASDFTTATTRTDAPAPQRDGIHHLRHTVPLGLACEEVDERSEDQPAKGRDKDDGGGAEDIFQCRLDARRRR